MQISEKDLNVEFLERCGEDVINFIKNRDYETLATRYGYLMLFDRKPADALQQDLTQVLETESDTLDTRIEGSSIVVKFFQPNETGLRAVVECIFEISVQKWIGADLIVNKTGNLYIEDIYSV